MKISVVTWDAAFRENIHTIRCISDQVYDKSLIQLEFLWVDYYNSSDVVKAEISTCSDARLITLNNDKSSSWHLGRCINEGVRQSQGDIIVVMDGDIFFDEHFVSYVHQNCNVNGIVSYFRRFDEPECSSCQKSYSDLNYLDKNCILKNATNYAGCFALYKDMFEAVNGYEVHDVFSGAGMNAMEAYIRFRNAGFGIRWVDKKIYHPWHFSTGLSDVELEQRKKLRSLMQSYPWINCYSGIKQSWVVRCRELNLNVMADAERVDGYLSKVPRIDLSKLQS